MLLRQRFCPICKNTIIYTTKSKRKIADKNNCKCRTCSNKSRVGVKHPMFGKESAFKGRKHTEESKSLIGGKSKINNSGVNNPMYGTQGGMFGKKHTEETKDKISKSQQGKVISDETKSLIYISRLEYYKENDNPRKGKPHTEEAKTKMRLSAIKRVYKNKEEGFQFYPTYNKNSIPILEDYARTNNLNLIHAENGGEFFVVELGFWVDGYDKERNIVVEYNEKYHNYRKDKDLIRRELIIKKLLCEFHIINEDGSIEIFTI